MTRQDAVSTGELTKPKDIVSNVRGSFAWSVLHDRHPAIIQQASAALPYPPHIRKALETLQSELGATIQPLRTESHDTDLWARWGRDYIGENWYDVPFLWAESFFYRKLLEAVEYFQPGPWNAIDQFAPQKSAELHDLALDKDLVALGRLQILPLSEQITAALDAALWGNRADLGFLLSDPSAAHNKQAGALVADDGDALRGLLTSGDLDRVCLVADNAGRELISDLILIDLLLKANLVRTVDLHLKPQPYYVSDATTADLLACLQRISQADETRPVAERLFLAVADGRLLINAHPFYCEPLTYHDRPADLSKEFAKAGLVILKGDLNYRRLVGDRDWPNTFSFAQAAAYFPTKVATLRILKSDVVIGLNADNVQALDDDDPSWRKSGTHGLVQVSI